MSTPDVVENPEDPATTDEPESSDTENDAETADSEGTRSNGPSFLDDSEEPPAPEDADNSAEEDKNEAEDVDAPAPTVLRVDELTVAYGEVLALSAVSFEIRRGEVVGLIGPNGAGKTSCIDALTGVVEPTFGRIEFDGEPVSGLKPHQRARRGIGRTFQDPRVFGDMTALENVAVGTDALHDTSVWGALLRLPRHRREESDAVDAGMGLLEFVGLAGSAHTNARELARPARRRLEIARILAGEPQLLCLDEPAAGLAARDRRELIELIERICDKGYTVLIADQDMRFVRGLCERIVVLQSGRKLTEGLPSDIEVDDRVAEAYLGV